MNLTKKWIEIAKTVSENPLSKIKCPNCNESFLNIFIVPWKNCEPKLDIHLICDSCNERNTITKESLIADEDKSTNS